jgi:hypothetical protein
MLLLQHCPIALIPIDERETAVVNRSIVLPIPIQPINVSLSNFLLTKLLLI